MNRHLERSARPTRRRWALCATVALLALVSCACGVPNDPSAHAIPKSQVPSGLLRTTPTTVTTTTVAHQATQATDVPIYLLRTGLLVERIRKFQEPTSSSTLERLTYALSLLAVGPNAIEGRSDIATALSSNSDPTLASWNQKTGVATVNLDSTFGTLAGTALADAFGQIVFTLTAQSTPQRVTGIRFTFLGTPVGAYTPSGEQIGSEVAVSRTQYAGIAPAKTTP